VASHILNFVTALFLWATASAGTVQNNVATIAPLIDPARLATLGERAADSDQQGKRRDRKRSFGDR